MQAIRRVLAGEIYLSEEATSLWLNRSLGKTSGTASDPVGSQLADRELQVFELVGKGHSTRQIAELLALDVKTIETYRARIKDKLGLKDAPELLQRAIAWVHGRG
jgi:DNA-binding NarL/FixJ family response regulator